MAGDVFVVVDVGLRPANVFHVFGKFSEEEADGVVGEISQYYLSWWRWLGLEMSSPPTDAKDRIFLVEAGRLDDFVSRAKAVEYRELNDLK